MKRDEQWKATVNAAGPRGTAHEADETLGKRIGDVLEAPSHFFDDSIPPAVLSELLYGPKDNSIDGTPLPDDLPDLALFVAKHHVHRTLNVSQFYPSVMEKCCFDIDDAQHQAAIYSVAAAYRAGFAAAVIVYGDDLRNVSQAQTIRAALERGRKKGANVVRAKAAPKKAAVRKRFRELRKSGFTKTNARRLIEQETKISFRQIERDTAGLA
jgi:ribosomal protein L7/L12